MLVRPARQSRRSAHFLILQLILPRFCAKRYTRRAVFPHLPKCLWKKGSKMAFACALAMFSGRIILNFAFVAACGPLQTHFHGRGRRGKRQLQRRFLRKRGAAGNVFAEFQRAEPSQSSLRDASSPEGGALSALTGRCVKAPPSGELARERLRGFAPPWGSCRAATEGL